MLEPRHLYCGDELLKCLEGGQTGFQAKIKAKFCFVLGFFSLFFNQAELKEWREPCLV